MTPRAGGKLLQACLGLALAVAATGCGVGEIATDPGAIDQSELRRLGCGDGVCSRRETCSTCPQDCGSCGGTGTDTIPPSISVASPSPGANLSGSVVVSGTASDNVSVAKVEVRVDAQPYVQATGTTSWSCTLPLSGLPSGSHLITANATDASGNTAQASVTVNLIPVASSGCSTQGVQKVAVILVTFPNVTLATTGMTAQGLKDIFFNTSTGRSYDGFLREASYGQASATGDVFGPYLLTGSYAACTDLSGPVLNDAFAAAIAGGADLSSYNRFALVFPDVLGCGWAGFASNLCSVTVPSGSFNATLAYFSANSMVTRDDGVKVVGHELGHNMGVMHSGVLGAVPGSGTVPLSTVLGPLSSPGTFHELGDYWSIMGSWELGQYPAPQKAMLGWLAAGSDYQVVQTSGTFLIQPLEAASGLRALKVQRGTGNDAWLWIEYRARMGNYDTTLSTQPFDGALIHYEDSTSLPGSSKLLNFTPSDTTGWSPALAAGHGWTDSYSNLSLVVNSATSAGLSITVTYAP